MPLRTSSLRLFLPLITLRTRVSTVLGDEDGNRCSKDVVPPPVYRILSSILIPYAIIIYSFHFRDLMVYFNSVSTRTCLTLFCFHSLLPISRASIRLGVVLF